MVKKPQDTNHMIGELMEFTKKQLERQAKKLDEIIDVVGLQQDILQKVTEDMRDVRQGQLSHDKRFDQLEALAHATARAVDKDAVKVIDHERRLIRMEVRGRR